MFYKNLNDNNLMFFSETPNENWVLASEDEIASYQLLQAKMRKDSEVRVARQYFHYANLIVDGKEFKATRLAKLCFWARKNSLQKLNSPLSNNYPIEWRLADDVTWTSLDEAQATALEDAMKAQDNSALHQESTFYEAINEATSLEEVEAINVKFV